MEAFQRSAFNFVVSGFAASVAFLSAVETQHPMAIALTILLAIPCVLSALALIAMNEESRR